MIVCRQCKERYEGAEPSFCGRCGADLRRVSRSFDEGSLAEALDDGHGVGADVLADPMIGRVVGGRYRVLERLGSGGMGMVYKVEHTAMGKLAALKMLHPTLSAERELVKRFRTEARAVSLLTHPNTVQVFDFGEADGSLFMVMELVRGEALGAIVEREGPLPWRRAAPLLLQICEALAEAHEAGIIHRDIKPENVLVTRTREGRETVKVLDFGLAKLREQGALSTSTGKGSVIGTPYFMSPEQIRGEELDARSDIYSLGALAYEVLSGEHPFDGDTPIKVLTAHLTETLVPPSQRKSGLQLDRRIEGLVVKCLARDPAKRFASTDELRRALETLIEASGPVRRAGITEMTASAKVPSMSPVPQLSREDFDRFERGLRRRRWVGLALGLAMLAGAAGGGAWLLLRGDLGPPVTEEIEPNNDAAHANLIAEGQPVRGHIGKRLALEASDRDFYHVRVPRGPVVAHVDVSGIPNMQLHLALFDQHGDKLAEADSGGAGDPEVIPDLRLEAGEYWAEVREEWVAGGMATENVTDWYSLRVSWHTLGSEEEAEPDDTPATALSVPLGQPVIGYLGRVGDVDFYYPRGEPGGVLDGRVSGVAGVDLRLVTLPPGTVVTGDPAAAPGARVFDSGGVGAAEEFSGVPWPSTGGAPLIVVARKDPPLKGSAATHYRAVGIDLPYTLLLNRRASR